LGDEKIKYAASLITTGRIIGAFVLLLTTPLSVLFFIVYAPCCASDILDGYIARKTKTTSKLGEALDSIADFVLVAVLLVVFIPLLAWEWWTIYWIGIIALTRFLSLGIGYAKYRAVSFLHTYANKVTGIALVCFPILFWLFGITVTAFILCGIASISAFEELIITIRSNTLNRNVKSVFGKG
jgi:CDP-diacylglycerol--glycerol-3-phosphate 3-phosphatidyltransferase